MIDNMTVSSCGWLSLVILLLAIPIRIIFTQNRKYSIYWNVPTFQCHKYGYNFSNVNHYGIIQNKGDKFNGSEYVILYDPGYYPAIINGKERNGGVPQNGNIHKHLDMFENDLKNAIPDPNFQGIGVIDFEHWRPIYRENWAKLDIYRQKSKEIEEKKYPYLNHSTIEKKAEARFEKSAFLFMNETLNLAINLRPKAKWGYYAYPYCFNFSPKNFRKECTKEVMIDNDRSTWMYKTGTAVFPSVYLQQKTLSEGKRAKLIEYRVAEGRRVSRLGPNLLTLLTYTNFKYIDTGAFLSQGDMESNLAIPKNNGADGVVIWGSSNDVNTLKKCSRLNDYVEKVIGPIIERLDLQNNNIN